VFQVCVLLSLVPQVATAGALVEQNQMATFRPYYGSDSPLLFWYEEPKATNLGKTKSVHSDAGI